MLMTEPVRSTWRTRGQYWSHAQLDANLGRSVFASAVVVRLNEARDIIGLLELVDVDLIDRRAQLSTALDASYWRTGLPIRAALLYLQAMFDTYPIDKIVMTSLANNPSLGSALDRFFEREGLFRREVLIGGVRQDLVRHALWKDQLDDLRARLMPNGY